MQQKTLEQGTTPPTRKQKQKKMNQEQIVVQN